MSGAIPVDVSCETTARLRQFAVLVEKWSRKINLVAPDDLPQLWSRHILDSAQLADLAPETAFGHAINWLDLGAGGGFPGLVLAVIFADSRPDITVTLVESDGRKAAFLHQAAAQLGVAVTIHTARAENLAPQGADIVSARALAPLNVLLAHVRRHLAPGGRAIFPKGRNWADEVANARQEWQLSLTTRPSLTDPEARILVVEGLSRV